MGECGADGDVVDEVSGGFAEGEGCGGRSGVGDGAFLGGGETVFDPDEGGEEDSGGEGPPEEEGEEVWWER